ncbi:MAG: hypothetical protein HDR43_02950 [Mycoplasma sp.]|nr:hypothetical protein [Mycoplasma sp.]
MNKQKNVFEMIDITISEDKNEGPFLISNLNVKLDENKTYAFYFKNEIEKNAFVSLFSGETIEYNGIIKINDKIHNSLTSNINNDISFHNINLFDNVDPKIRVIEVIEKEIIKYKLDSIIESININNKYEKNIKLLKLFRYKKVELSYYRTINILIKKAIQQLESLNEELRLNEKNNQELLEMYEYFIYSHIKYLKSRINLVIDRNIMIVDLYNKKFDKKIDEDKENEFNERAKDLIDKTEVFEIYDKSLTKIKKQTSHFINDVNIKSEIKDRDISFNKNVVNSMLIELKFKKDFYSNSLKKINKNKRNSREFLNFFVKKIILNELIKIVKKDSLKLLNLKNKEIMSFLNEMKKIYNETLMIFEKDIISNQKDIQNTKKLKLMTIDYTNKEFSMIANKYISNINNQKNDNKDQIKIKNKLYERDHKNEIISNVESIKIEYQDLLDEIDWENKSIFYQLNDDLNIVFKSITKEYEEYKNNKLTYNNLLTNFLTLKNSALDKVKFDSIYKRDKLHDKVFINESLKFETIYKFVSNDTNILESLFSKTKIKLSKNIISPEIISITRYLIFKSSKNINISIFDFLKRTGKINNLLRNTFFLIIGLMDGRHVTMYENLFSNLNYNDYKNFLNLYKKCVVSSNKKWILIESNILSAKDAADEVSIIDNSKQIEFGKTEAIFNNPIYDVTIEAFGLKTTDSRETPILFNNYLDFVVGYDYYEISPEHYLYGNIDKIYRWTKVVPNKMSKTVSDEELNNLKNKIAFDKISNKKKKEIKDNKNNNKSISEFDTQEFLIVDVTQ